MRCARCVALDALLSFEAHPTRRTPSIPPSRPRHPASTPSDTPSVAPPTSRLRGLAIPSFAPLASRLRALHAPIIPHPALRAPSIPPSRPSIPSFAPFTPQHPTSRLRVLRGLHLCPHLQPSISPSSLLLCVLRLRAPLLFALMPLAPRPPPSALRSPSLAYLLFAVFCGRK